MNTVIKINGLDVEFSEKVPTRVGFWLWTQGANRTIYPTRVWQEGHMFASSELGSCTCVDDIGGLWSTSQLVPAVEVEKAYHEGHSHGRRQGPMGRTFGGSRAKRVAEGGE